MQCREDRRVRPSMGSLRSIDCDCSAVPLECPVSSAGFSGLVRHSPILLPVSETSELRDSRRRKDSADGGRLYIVVCSGYVL